jgi:FkbM family methyltransferase
MNKRAINFIANKLRPVELIMLVKFLSGLKRVDYPIKGGLKYNIDPLSNLGLTLINDKVYEPEMTNIIYELLQSGDSFVDLGSNEGYFSIIASSICGPTGKIFAIEPQSRLWGVIIRNAILNDLTNIQLIPYGVGANSAELIMNLYPELNSGASTFSTNFNFNVKLKSLRNLFYKKENIKIITLNKLKASLPPKIKLIKIDIEGFELEAIKGSTELLAEKAFENILIEIHTEALKGLNQTEEDLNNFITAYGYKSKKIAYNLNLYYL